jgi:hypothetical protein
MGAELPGKNFNLSKTPEKNFSLRAEYLRQRDQKMLQKVGGAHCEESEAFGEEEFPYSRTVWYLCAENLHRDANFHPFPSRLFEN